MKILVFGSLNIDHVYQLNHLVREGETLSSSRYEKHEGGKGLNQAIALKKAGAEVSFAGAIGQDGLFLRAFLDSAGVDTKHLKVLDAPTGHAVIQVDEEGHNAIFLYGGTNRLIDSAMIDKVLSFFGEGDYLLLQNEISGLKDLLTKARHKGIGIILNPSPISDELLQAPLEYVDWLLLNEIEGFDITGKEAPQEVLDVLLERYPNCHIVLTLGAKGAVYADKGQRISQAATPTNVVDTTAAGDTFTGYFIHNKLSGRTAAQALDIAGRAAAIAVSRPGAGQSIPYANEVI